MGSSGRLDTLQNLVNKHCGAMEHLATILAVGHETASVYERPRGRGSRKLTLQGELANFIRAHQERSRTVEEQLLNLGGEWCGEEDRTHASKESPPVYH